MVSSRSRSILFPDYPPSAPVAEENARPGPVLSLEQLPPNEMEPVALSEADVLDVLGITETELQDEIRTEERERHPHLGDDDDDLAIEIDEPISHTSAR